MNTSSSRTRFYVDLALNEGAEVRFDAAQQHKLRNVLRSTVGDVVCVFNGRDGEWNCKITILGRRDSMGVVTEHIREHSNTVGPILLFAPLKRQRMQFLVEKSTELGARSFWPVVTEYSAVRKVNLEKLGATIREAAEQCHRLDLAKISSAAPLFDALDKISAEERILFCDEAQGGEWGIGDSAADRLASGHSIGVLIGPEGGFSPEERKRLLEDQRLVPISLGPRPLRAETAAVAAIACWHMMTASAGSKSERAR